MSDAVTLTEELIFRLAPDGKSTKAARELVKGNAFREPAISTDGTHLEALCQGSEGQPYRVRGDLSGGEASFSCTCSSFKYPCKHALGLLFLALEARDRFAERESPGGTVKGPPLPLAEPVAPPEPPRNDGEALWQALCEQPEEPAHRLVYADWLDEQNDPEKSALAAFIRVQCERARLPPDSPRQAALGRQEQQLLSRNRSRWLADVPKHLRGKVAFRGGLIEHLEWNPRTLIRWGDELCEHYPISSLRLTEPISEKEAAELVVQPFLSRIQFLDLRHSVSVKALELLVSSPFLANVRRLDLSENNLGLRGARALVQASFLAKLEVLALSRCDLGDTGVAVLCEAALDRLRVLDLRSNRIGSAAARALAGGQHLEGLTSLDLRGIQLAEKSRERLRQRFGERVKLDA